MAKSRHIQKRMSQRGINQRLLDLVCNYGCPSSNGEKWFLNKKACTELLSQLDKLRQDVLRSMTRGGFVVVQDDGTLVTTYALDSYQR